MRCPLTLKYLIRLFASSLAAAVLWIMLMTWVLPYLYTVLSRNIRHDYAYLWNNVPSSIHILAWPGALAIMLWAIYTGINLLIKGNPGGICPNVAKGPAIKPRWQIILIRECMLALVITFISLTAFLISSRAYENMRIQYFDSVISKESGYIALTSNEKAAARDQYTLREGGHSITRMFNDLGWKARALFSAQQVLFWAILFLWPTIIYVRFLIWTRRLR